MTNHLGPGYLTRQRRDDLFHAECGTETQPKHTIEDSVDDVDCDACLDLAAQRMDDDLLASCPTVDDLVERTDATRYDVYVTANAEWFGRRITDRIEARGDRVIVLNISEREILEAALLDVVDAEADE